MTDDLNSTHPQELPENPAIPADLADHSNPQDPQDTKFQEALPETLGSPIPPAAQDDELLPAARGQSQKWLLIGGLLVIFLAAAVFLGARLIKKPQGGADSPGRGGMFLSSKGGPAGGQKSVRLNMIPAKELPQEQPGTNGVFVRREDQSIFIGTGSVRVSIKKSSNSASSPGDLSSSYDGPVVEVVINHQTQIYQDITEMTPPDESQNGEVTVEQKVKPGSLDFLGANSLVTVWGDKQGDRFIARVIAFR